MNLNISKPTAIGLALILVTLLGLGGVIILSEKNKSATEVAYRTINTAALDEIFPSESRLVQIANTVCDQPTNPLAKESCQQSVLNVYEGSGNIDTERSTIRSSLAKHGWSAEPWRLENATYFWEEQRTEVKDALAEASAQRNSQAEKGETHNARLKIAIVKQVDERSEVLKVAGHSLKLSSADLQRLQDSKADYFIVASIDSRFAGSY